MVHRSRSVLILSVMVVLIQGCMWRGARRAPIDTIPEDVDTEVRIHELEQMTKEYPDDANLFFVLANVYYEEALISQAKINYQKALSLDPKMNEARVNLGMLLADAAKPDSAKLLLEEALRIDPTDDKAWTNLGLIYYSEKNVDDAVKAYSRAIEIEPLSQEAHYNLGLAFTESGLLLEAIREFRKVLEISEEGETSQRARVSLERIENALKK